jgi:large subunit ribosomal protein L15
MKLKKRKKVSRMGGTRYHGHAMKKHKGKGNKGGKGMSGTGKRGDQKKTYVVKYLKDYFGRKPSRSMKKIKNVNIRDIEKNLGNFIKNGLAKKTNEGIEVTLKNYKILGNGEVKEKLIIKAKSFSKQAKAKIEKAGGKAVILKPVKKEEKPEK